MSTIKKIKILLIAWSVALLNKLVFECKTECYYYYYYLNVEQNYCYYKMFIKFNMYKKNKKKKRYSYTYTLTLDMIIEASKVTLY